MKCPRCGLDNSAELEFCSICGLPLKPQSPSNHRFQPGSPKGPKPSNSSQSSNQSSKVSESSGYPLYSKFSKASPVSNPSPVPSGSPSVGDVSPAVRSPSDRPVSPVEGGSISVHSESSGEVGGGDGLSPALEKPRGSGGIGEGGSAVVGGGEFSGEGRGAGGGTPDQLRGEESSVPLDGGGSKGNGAFHLSEGSSPEVGGGGSPLLRRIQFPPKELLVRPLEVEIPGLGRRFLAGLVDLILVSLLAWVGVALFGPKPDGPIPSLHPIDLVITGISSLRVQIVLFIIITAAIYGIYSALIVGFTGTTVGKKVLGMKIAAMSGSEIGWSESIARAVAFSLFSLLFLLAPLSILLSSTGRGVHDLVSGTIVVKSK